MKRLLLASVSVFALIATSPAHAADLPATMPRKAPPIAPAPPFSWTGCYIGGNVGYGWGRKTFSDVLPDGVLVGDFDPSVSLPVDTGGFLGGGQLGCNYQFAPAWVAGIEGDVSAANISGSGTTPAFDLPLNAKTDWIASVTVRVGYTWDRWLAYAKGGAAWADDKYNATYGGTYDASETRSGWTVGAGLEWAFANNWSARLEYDYYDFGTRNVTFTSPSDSSTESVKQQIQAVKFGINYRFGASGPIMSRY